MATPPSVIQYDERDFPPSDLELALFADPREDDRSSGWSRQNFEEEDFSNWGDGGDVDNQDTASADAEPLPAQPTVATARHVVQPTERALRAFKKLDRWTRHGFPNSLLLTAIFRPLKPGGERQRLDNVELPVFAEQRFCVRVSGYELDAGEGDVLRTVALAAWQTGEITPESVVYRFTIKQLLKDLHRGDSGPERRALMASLELLSRFHLHLDDGRFLFSGNLLRYTPDLLKGDFVVRFDRDFYNLFARGWTHFPWQDRWETLRRKPFALWLHGVFCASMREEMTYSVRELHRVSCVKVSLPEFRRMLKKALPVLERTAALEKVLEMSPEHLHIKRTLNRDQLEWQQKKLQRGVPRPLK